MKQSCYYVIASWTHAGHAGVWALKIFPLFGLFKVTVYEADLSVFPKVCTLLIENNALILLHVWCFSEQALFKIAVSVQSFMITQVRYVTINRQEVQNGHDSYNWPVRNSILFFYPASSLNGSGKAQFSNSRIFFFQLGLNFICCLH